MAGSQAGTVQLPEKTPPSSRAEVEIKPTAARMAAEAAWELASPEQWPGLSDAARFQLDANVGWWREYVHNSSVKNLETLENSQKLFRELLEVAAREPSLRSPQAALYWGYHLARAGFFSLQGMLSILATGLRQGTLGEQRSTHVWGGISIPRFARTSGVGMLAEALPMFRQDLRFIQAGHYKLPWDMTTATHRQYNPFYVLDKAGQYVRDATRVLERRRNGEPEPVWLASPLYPSYYLNTFHYQTDGWLSAQSAQVYESQTETLFVGRQDAMQRLALVPLGQFIVAAERPVEELRLVELACGTGRFMTFIKDNHPRLKATAVDLSPFYLQEARSNVAYWKAKRQPQLPDQGGYKGTGVDFVQAAAERTGLPDASADVVSMTYLFHELPREARLEVLRESFRLLRPGGLLILTDSVQLGDRKSYDKTIDRFQHFNEPHWADYVKHDLGAAMEACGFHCGMKLVGSSTKCLTAVKPV